MTRPTTRLAHALQWWATYDDEAIPARHLPSLRELVELCPVEGDVGAMQLNADGRQAMRNHGYTQTDLGAWELAREDGAP